MVRTRINGMAVYDFMARNNLSQREWAERVGISQCYASQLVCGTRCPSPRLRRRMLLVMNPLEFGELFALEKEAV